MLSILDHVQQHLLQVVVVCPDVGHGLEVHAHGDAFGLEPGFLEGHHFLDLLRHLAAHAPRRAVLGEED